MNEHTHRKSDLSRNSDIHVVFIRNSSLNFVHGTIFCVCVFLGRYNSIRCAWNDSKLIEKKLVCFIYSFPSKIMLNQTVIRNCSKNYYIEQFDIFLGFLDIHVKRVNQMNFIACFTKITKVSALSKQKYDYIVLYHIHNLYLCY